MLADAAKATIHTVALSTDPGTENNSSDEEKPGCDSGTHPGLMASLPRHAHCHVFVDIVDQDS
jgi:hypothetical protein